MWIKIRHKRESAEERRKDAVVAPMGRETRPDMDFWEIFRSLSSNKLKLTEQSESFFEQMNG